MKQPSESDIEAAKAYLRQRLAAEQSMCSNLERVMKDAAERIVAICYAANVNPQNLRYEILSLATQLDIDAVIVRMRQLIDDYFQTLAIAEHTDTESEVLPLILGENHGLTFEERLSDYCEKYKNELLLLIGAGLFLGVAEPALTRSLKENIRRPYANQLLAEGIAAPITYGKGRTNSMYTAISDLMRFGIAQAWMASRYINNRKDGCAGWFVMRGSSYPCELCDSYVGFHADESELPPYHGHCACFAVPIFL